MKEVPSGKMQNDDDRNEAESLKSTIMKNGS